MAEQRLTASTGLVCYLTTKVVCFVSCLQLTIRPWCLMEPSLFITSWSRKLYVNPIWRSFATLETDRYSTLSVAFGYHASRTSFGYSISSESFVRLTDLTKRSLANCIRSIYHSHCDKLYFVRHPFNLSYRM